MGGGNGSQTLNKYFPHSQSCPCRGQVVLRRKVSDTDIVLERRRGGERGVRRQTAAVTRAGCQHTFLTARQMKGKLEGKNSGSGNCYLRVLHISNISESGFLTFTGPPIIWAENGNINNLLNIGNLSQRSRHEINKALLTCWGFF